MPGLIWVRDLMVGDVMVDRSWRVERLRPLGLSWAATLAWEPQSFWELVGSLGAIWSLGVAERAVGSVCVQVVVIGSSAAGPSSRRMWKERRASLRSEERV